MWEGKSEECSAPIVESSLLAKHFYANPIPRSVFCASDVDAFFFPQRAQALIEYFASKLSF